MLLSSLLEADSALCNLEFGFTFIRTLGTLKIVEISVAIVANYFFPGSVNFIKKFFALQWTKKTYLKSIHLAP